MGQFLVTGGAGFIGSHLVRYLSAHGHGVRVFDNRRPHGGFSLTSSAREWIQGDVRDACAVRDAMRDMDGCFHLAAAQMGTAGDPDRGSSHETNVGGMINVLEAARGFHRGAPKRVVFASSATVYGDNAGQPFHESAEIRPLSAYGVDKATCEMEARIASIQHDVPSIGLRLFNVFGAGQRADSPYAWDLWQSVVSLLDDRSVVIGGDCHSRSDWTFIDDILPFFELAMCSTRSGAELFNVCSGKSTSTLELLRLLAALLQRELRLEHAPRHGRMLHCGVGDPRRARSLLRCEVKTDLAAGMRRAIGHLVEASGPRRPEWCSVAGVPILLEHPF